MLEFVKNLALQAGAMALAERKRMNQENIHEKRTKDLVTDSDRAVEEFITAALKAEYPDFGIFGEEHGKDNADNEYCWVIDPIDGTSSFVADLPNWCVSIGLTRNGIPILGVVYAPRMNELFYAEKGGGAWCNGMRLSVSKRSQLVNSIVVAGFFCLRENWVEENNLRYFARIAPLVCDIRKYGSAALDCCAVAAGRVEAFWELCLQPYDMAAGAVIVSEAGGKITDLFGGENYPHQGIMVTNGVIHDTMLSFFYDFKNLKK